VIGPPGAGKTTYCHGMSLFALSLGRQCAIVNLDFANDILPYTPTIDVRELVSQEVCTVSVLWHACGMRCALICLSASCLICFRNVVMFACLRTANVHSIFTLWHICLRLQKVMEEQELGPNGSLIYCMEYLLDNIYWLIDRLAKLKSHYIIFDCPGQVRRIVYFGEAAVVPIIMEKYIR
jgi:GTPase SAR1 family protein